MIKECHMKARNVSCNNRQSIIIPEVIFWHIQIHGYAAELLGNNPWESIRNDNPGLGLSGPRILPVQPTKPFLPILCSFIHMFVHLSGVLLNPTQKGEKEEVYCRGTRCLKEIESQSRFWFWFLIFMKSFEILWVQVSPCLTLWSTLEIVFWEKEKAANVILPEPQRSPMALFSQTVGVMERALVHRERWKCGDQLELGWSAPRKMGASW